MFGKFWGDHVQGKLTDLMNLINEDDPDIIIKILPLLENNSYGSPQLLLSKRPSDECIDKMSELYSIRLFKNDGGDNDYRYLMVIETLRYAYEENWHYDGDISRDITHNRWNHDGYFFITDLLNDYCRIAIIPYSSHAYELDGGDNMSRQEALQIVQAITKRLNHKELLYD